MRRLPIYILIDTSGSMRGDPIEAVCTGLQALKSSLERDPHALETVALSIITFDNEARVVTPLTQLEDLQLPIIGVPETGATNIGEAIELLLSRYDIEVVKSSSTQKGDWLPLAVIMTDGKPSDTALFGKMTAKIKTYKFARVIACAAGPKAKDEPLKLIADEVVHLDTMDSNTFSKFWAWVSTAVSHQSQTIGSASDNLPPPPNEIKLVF